MGGWLANVLGWFFLQSPYTTTIEFESSDSEHGDLEFLYVLEGIVDRRWGRKPDKTLPVTISVYGIGWDESYEKAMGRDPIFSGTAYEYIERFGNEGD